MAQEQVYSVYHPEPQIPKFPYFEVFKNFAEAHPSDMDIDEIQKMNFFEDETLDSSQNLRNMKSKYALQGTLPLKMLRELDRNISELSNGIFVT